MKREEWEFDYTGSKLAEAAAKKRAHHKERQSWWESEKQKVLTKVKESGIEVHHEVAESYSNMTRGYGPQIVIDPMLQRDLQECQEKIVEHSSNVKSYDGWVQVLTANPEARLALNHDDFLFFYGE